MSILPAGVMRRNVPARSAWGPLGSCATGLLVLSGVLASPIPAQQESALRPDATSFFLGVTAGPLVAIGGGRLAENGAVYRAILDRRKGDGPVCVIPTANQDVPTAMRRGVNDLNRYGGDSAAIAVDLGVHNAQRAFDPTLAGDLRTCSGFFFEGGQQDRILQVFRPHGVDTPAYEAILARFREGAVVAGTSAGAAMMSEVMIRGGTSESALARGVGAPGTDAGVLRQSGMAFLEGAVIDQHFLARGRVGRLLVTLLDSASAGLGLGIDEQTALVIDSTRAVVIGASSVVLLDTRQAVSWKAGREWRGIRMYLLGAGDQLDLETGCIVEGRGKQMVSRVPGSVAAPGDLFEPLALLRLVMSMAAADRHRVTVPAGRQDSLRFTKGDGFRAVAWDSLARYQPFDHGIPSHWTARPAGFSAGPFQLDLIRGSP